jgi:hypothetical protein
VDLFDDRLVRLLLRALGAAAGREETLGRGQRYGKWGTGPYGRGMNGGAGTPTAGSLKPNQTKPKKKAISIPIFPQ